jgi:hypothetical protein
MRTASKRRTHLSQAKKVEAKVADFDIKGAVKKDVAKELKKNILYHLANFFFQTLSNRKTFL